MNRTKQIKTIREGLKLIEQQLVFMESLDENDFETNYRTIKALNEQQQVVVDKCLDMEFTLKAKLED